jgi:Na+-driven multidrug efflux pump
VILATADLWLTHVRAAPEVQTPVASYLRILCAALPAALMFRAVYALNVCGVPSQGGDDPAGDGVAV